MSKRTPGETRGRRGLDPSARKQQRSIGLPAADWARIDRVWQEWTGGRISRSEFYALLLANAIHSNGVRGLIYSDSGQSAADEAAENAADYAEAHQMIARGAARRDPAD